MANVIPPKRHPSMSELDKIIHFAGEVKGRQEDAVRTEAERLSLMCGLLHTACHLAELAKEYAEAYELERTGFYGPPLRADPDDETA